MRAVAEGLAVVDPDKRQEAMNKMWRILHEAHYLYDTGTINLPWGVSPRIATWEPWPLTPYNSAFWTITLK